MFGPELGTVVEEVPDTQFDQTSQEVSNVPPKDRTQQVLVIHRRRIQVLCYILRLIITTPLIILDYVYVKFVT